MSSYGPPSPGVALDIFESAHKHKLSQQRFESIHENRYTRRADEHALLRGAYYCMCSYHIERFESQNAPGLRLAVRNSAPWTCISANQPIMSLTGLAITDLTTDVLHNRSGDGLGG